MKSLPLSANNASSSVAIQRSLEVALQSEQRKVKYLLQEIDRLRGKDVVMTDASERQPFSSLSHQLVVDSVDDV